MLRKIYHELVLIRKELQAIHNCKEQKKDEEIKKLSETVTWLQNYMLKERKEFISTIQQNHQ